MTKGEVSSVVIVNMVISTHSGYEGAHSFFDSLNIAIKTFS